MRNSAVVVVTAGAEAAVDSVGTREGAAPDPPLQAAPTARAQNDNTCQTHRTFRRFDFKEQQPSIITIRKSIGL